MLFQSERNVKLHVLAVVIVAVLGFTFKISLTEWAILVLCAGGVLAAEAINTSIESIVDLFHPERSDKAGRIKDIAAAGVLIMSISALIAGLLIFLPKVLAQLQ